jgi:hypothetical protein
VNVDQFLSKPYHPRELLSLIWSELARARATRPDSRFGRLGRETWRSDDGQSGPSPSHTLVKAPRLD